MHRILQLLEQDARITPARIAKMLGMTEQEVKDSIHKYERDDVILGYKAIVDWGKIKRDNIQKIVDNKKKPTFQNTILAFEESGILLDRVCSVFFGLTNADKTPVLAEAEDKVMPLLTSEEMTPFKLSSNDLRDTNLMQIFVFGSADQVLLCARLDNLGKGASGAAVQCLNIMMGIDETTGLL